jgi:hypothetical protein
MILTRFSSLADWIRVYAIIVDGKDSGCIRAGETLQLSLSPGNHKIYLKIDWCRSNAIDFEVKEADETKFECGSSLTGWRLLLGLIYISFWRNKYLWIRQVA